MISVAFVAAALLLPALTLFVADRWAAEGAPLAMSHVALASAAAAGIDPEAALRAGIAGCATEGLHPGPGHPRLPLGSPLGWGPRLAILPLAPIGIAIFHG